MHRDKTSSLDNFTLSDSDDESLEVRLRDAEEEERGG